MDFENRHKDEFNEKSETLSEISEGEDCSDTADDADTQSEADVINEFDEVGVTEQDGESEEGERKMSFFDSLFNWAELFAIYFSVGIFIILFLIGHSYVDGDSMNNTLYDKDIMLISKLPYTPEPGDIIVCQTTESYGIERPLVKRVIAVGGQEVTIDYINWKVTVDGVTLDENYVRFEEGKIMNPSNYLKETFTVPEGKVFVMGDNRNHSLDSRSAAIGFIDERYILGKIKLRVYPFSEFEIYG